MRITRVFLLIEAIAFAGASLTHLGLLLHGFEHQAAGIAEATICGVLIVALIATYLRPDATRLVGLVGQAVALLGTSVGVLSMVRGFGPRSLGDLAFHVGVLAVLVAGLIVVSRAGGPNQSEGSEVR